MFKITIEGATMQELATSALALAAQFQTTAGGEATAPKPQTRSRKLAPAAETADTSAPEQTTNPASASPPEDAELARELNEPVEPMPDTAKAVVDAGTGQPIAPQSEVKQVTMDDIKAAAAKLAAKDTPKLKALVEAAGGTNLSTIPKDKLTSFAEGVFKALEA